MIEALLWMAAGAAFYHFCSPAALWIWKQIKKLGNIKFPF